MVITVDKEFLLKAVSIADSVISPKSINTILSNCLFNVNRKEIQIHATDNEIGIKTKVDAVSDSVNSFVVNAKKLSSILKELPNDELIISINEDLLIDIKSKSKEIKGHYTLIGMNAKDFPELPSYIDSNSISINQGILKTLLKKVTYAASSDTIKPVFNGVFITADANGKITAVATDSRRLSIISRQIESKTKIESGIIIPLKTINEISRLLQNDGVCYFSIQKNQCFFKIDNTEIITRMVDGQFPNFKQVIPKEYLIEVELNTKKFLESVRRASIFTREPANKIVLTFKKNVLLIEANTPELGEAHEEISITSSSAENITIGLNALFLLEALREIDSDYIKCGITGQMNPMTLMPMDDNDYLSVIMPITIKSAQ